MWEKYFSARQVTDGNIIRRMRIACWIPKATNTHSVYVILIAFPLQQWSHEVVSVLRHTECPLPVLFYLLAAFFSNLYTVHISQWRTVGG